MRAVLKDIQDGKFARDWVEENETGMKKYNALLKEDLDRQIETVGRDLRGRMSWLQE
jgi:ketol-acid reductoisomerase